MARFHVSATFCLEGDLASWGDTIDARDSDDAFDQARRLLDEEYPDISKVDMYVNRAKDAA